MAAPPHAGVRGRLDGRDVDRGRIPPSRLESARWAGNRSRRLARLAGSRCWRSSRWSARPIRSRLARRTDRAEDVGMIAIPLAGGAPYRAAQRRQADEPGFHDEAADQRGGALDARPRLPLAHRRATARAPRRRRARGRPHAARRRRPEARDRGPHRVHRAMRRAGLRELRGDLVLDDAIYDVGESSVQDFDGDPSQPYNVRPFGMLMNFKATRIVVRPGSGGASLTLDPPLDGVDVVSRLRTLRGPCRAGSRTDGPRARNPIAGVREGRGEPARRERRIRRPGATRGCLARPGGRGAGRSRTPAGMVSGELAPRAASERVLASCSIIVRSTRRCFARRGWRPVANGPVARASSAAPRPATPGSTGSRRARSPTWSTTSTSSATT